MRLITRLWVWVWVAMTVSAMLAAPARVATAQAPTAAPRSTTLVEALTLAAQNNLGLRIAAFETVVARAQLAQAQAFKAGQLLLSAAYTRINERTSTITIPAGVLPAPCDTGCTIPLPFSPTSTQRR